MEAYNPLAEGHISDTKVNLEDGRKFWVLLKKGVPHEKAIKSYMEGKGYEYIMATITSEESLRIFYGWVQPLAETP